jgi:hypothetical protein
MIRRLVGKDRKLSSKELCRQDVTRMAVTIVKAHRQGRSSGAGGVTGRQHPGRSWRCGACCRSKRLQDSL